MSESSASPLRRAIFAAIHAGTVGMFILLFALLLLAIGVPGVEALLEMAFHLGAGWFFFLREKTNSLSIESEIWVPGLLAFLIAIVIAHTFLRGWALRRNRAWTTGMSATLAATLPILFTISFLVPGVVLQVRDFHRISWLKDGTASPGAWTYQLTHVLQRKITAFAQAHEGRFPQLLVELEGWEKRHLLDVDQNLPPEPPIYLGGGFALDSDPGLPLLITQRFLGSKGLSRYVLTIGGEQIDIPDEETDAWIQRSLDARVAKAR